MTAIRAKSVKRVILDFSTPKCSRYYIMKSLRTCEVIGIQESKERPEFTIFNNEIKVGMYTIELELPIDSSFNWHKLREYGDFQVSIYDTMLIDLEKDIRFKEQPWVAHNFFGQLRIKHLIDIIAYVHRLDKIKAFL